MRILYRRRMASWNYPLLCITHTDRPVDLKRCSLNFLELRYSAVNRLPPAEPFEALTPSREHSPHLGSITIWRFMDSHFGRPQLLAHLRPEEYKPQFAIWYRQRLWVLGVQELEVYDSNLSRLALIGDPWLSGAHTLVPDNRGNLLASCSASDSVLVIDQDTHQIVNTLRMPESWYGFNYGLARTDSVVDHYIVNDYQLTHLNCAWPWRQGILVSTLIQGAIGWFSEDGDYTELLRGFVGCHGARADERTGNIYFADSCLGAVILLSSDFTIRRRVDANSVWLHDAQQLQGDVFALSLADRNHVEIVDFSTRQKLAVIPCGEYGSSTQFVHYGA